MAAEQDIQFGQTVYWLEQSSDKPPQLMTAKVRDFGLGRPVQLSAKEDGRIVRYVQPASALMLDRQQAERSHLVALRRLWRARCRAAWEIRWLLQDLEQEYAGGTS